jgi:hypothetical protein
MVVGSLADDLQAHERDHELRREGRILQISVLRGDQSQQSATVELMGIQPFIAHPIHDFFAGARRMDIDGRLAGIKMLQEKGTERFTTLFMAPNK